MNPLIGKTFFHLRPRLGVWLMRATLAGVCLALLPWVSRIYNPMLPDFIEYWTAGRLNLYGLNPYGKSDLLALQQSLGWQENDPLMMWNPPWTLALVMPFSLIEYGLSRLVWYFLQVGIFLYCADSLWRVYGGPLRWRWVGWLVATFSSYSIHALVFGQISPFMLLGMIWFILLVERSMPTRNSGRKMLDPRLSDLLSGAASILISIKPQVFFLFYPLLIAWAVTKRRKCVLAGSGGAFLLALLVALAFNPLVVSQYLQAVRQYPPQIWSTPTLGYWVRHIFGLDKFWLQFPPMLIGLAWGIGYWFKKRASWNWAQEMPLLAAVSLITTAYAWTHDQVILIPTSMFVLSSLFARAERWHPATILWAVIWIAFHLGTIPLHFGQSDEWFVWQAPAILALYLLGIKLIPTRPLEV